MYSSQINNTFAQQMLLMTTSPTPTRSNIIYNAQFQTTPLENQQIPSIALSGNKRPNPYADPSSSARLR